MNDVSVPQEQILLLGESEQRYGAFRLESTASKRVACALSVGADPGSPALEHKGDPRFPNEDALLAVECGDDVLAVVADAHHGRFASHAILRSLSRDLEELPRTPRELMRRLEMLSRDDWEGDHRSATSLLALVFRGSHRGGFGYSFGDCGCRALGGRHAGSPINRRTDRYASPLQPDWLVRGDASFFEFDLAPGELLLAHTDGVDGCNYRVPERSIREGHLQAIFERVGADPSTFAEALMETALEGVDGFPGGQDNVAHVVVAG